ncbi:Tfp pilus assembly protein FimT/FimU [Roseateles sp. BYS78W]|uniref:Tfp pilus assembly protein FimT/FimU n=1 Tax=Pelomonas candidula TaxID=3299025 RepID=A0ABW7HE15_9BURK
MKHLAASRSRAGVTLVEMLIGVAVLGVILAVAVPSMTSFMERRRVIATAGEIADIFTYARSEANVVDQMLNIHVEAVPSGIADFGSCIRLSTGTNDNCRCSYAKACPVGDGVVLRQLLLPRSNSVSFAASATWQGTIGVVSFLRQKHLTDVQNLAVTVTGARTGAQLAVQYNNAGRVRICSPGGTISGFPTCG